MIGDHPYRAITEELRGQILTRVYAPGQKLPSEAELTQRFAVSRHTVRHAIQELVAQGLVVSVPTRGHLVRERKPLIWVASRPEGTPDPNLVDDGPHDVWSTSVRAQGRVPTENIRVEKLHAGDVAAEWLGVEVGALLVGRLRLRYVDGEPYSSAHSFYPHDVVAGSAIEMPDDIRPGVYAEFRRLGIPWIDTRDRVVSRGPTTEEAHRLRIPRGIQVTEVIRRSWIADGRCVRLTSFVLPQDRHEIEYHHPRAEEQA